MRALIAALVAAAAVWGARRGERQEPVRVASGDTIEVKGGEAGTEWWTGVAVQAMAPAPCLGVVIDRPSGLHELVTAFDSVRVDVEGAARSVPREGVRLEGCAR